MSILLRTLAAISLAAALGACGQMTGAKDKAGETEAPAAEGSADAAAKPDEDAKPPTPQVAPAGAEPDKPS